MSFQTTFDRIADKLPLPLGQAFLAFLQESSPYSKLNKLIDAYQVALQFSATILLQNFYSRGLAKEYRDTDVKIRERLSRPTTGDWMMIFRETSALLRKRKEQLAIPKVASLDLETLAEKLGSLRNSVRHGATLSSAESAALIAAHMGYFENLLTECEKLTALTLAVGATENPDGTSKVKQIVGLNPYILQEEKIPLAIPAGHLFVTHAPTGEAIDLYPFLIYDDARPSGNCCLLFNAISKKLADFIDYADGSRAQFESPHPLPECLRSRFPRATPSQGAQGANWFGDFIENSTQHFVGRKDELARLDLFAAGGPKRALVLIGPPGIGKTGLLAEWAKHEASLRHFIREGDPATQEPTTIFENLGLQLERSYQLKWSPPVTRNPADHRAEFERLLRLAAAKALAPIIILLDGLDEAERNASTIIQGKDARTILDWLPEPSMVPDNVRWVLSTRAEVLAHPAFATKFGPDKAEHYTLPALSDANVRELLFQVCTWQEVLIAASQVDRIVQRSEGSPLYLRMLIEDIAAGRASLAQADQLPPGVEGFFGRILKNIESESLQSEGPETSLLIKHQIQLLQDLRDKGDIPPQRFAERCNQVKLDFRHKAQRTALDLLALFAAAKEPFLLADARAALSRTSEQIDRAFHIVRTILEERQEDQFAIFHSAFREFLIAKRREAFHTATGRLVAWCSTFKTHQRPYALRHYIAHLCDSLTDKSLPPGTDSAQHALEETLTDFEFIHLKTQAASGGSLLSDYDLAVNSWPGATTRGPTPNFDPTIIPGWLRECTAAIAARKVVPHSDLGSGPVVATLLNKLYTEPASEHFGLTCNAIGGIQNKRGKPARIAAPEVFQDLFTTPPSSQPVVDEMRHTESTNITDTVAAQCDAPLQRVRDFRRFLQFHGDGFHLPQADIAALAYNQAESGAVTDKATELCQSKTAPWIRREARPSAPFSQPVLFRTFPDTLETVITPDFQTVITASLEAGEASLTLISARTGEIIRRLTAPYDSGEHHSRPAAPPAASIDGSTMVHGNAVWNLEEGCLQTTIEDDVRHVAISADGHLALTAKHAPNLELWDAQSGEHLRTLNCIDSEVHHVAISADGRLAAIASHWAMMSLYETETGQALATFHTTDHVLSVALTPDAKIVVFGGRDNTVRALSVRDLTLLREFDHPTDVTAVAVSHDGRIVVSADREGTLRAWNVQDGTMLRRIETHQQIWSLQVSADGSLAFGASRLWDLKAGKTPLHLRSETNSAASLFLSEDHHIAAGTSEGTAELWHEENGGVRLLADSTAGQATSQARSAAVAVHLKSPRRALLAFRDGSIAEWDSSIGQLNSRTDEEFLKPLREEEMSRTQARLDRFKAKGMDPELREICERHATRERSYQLACASFSAHGDFLVTAVDGESVRIWKVETGRCTAALPIHVLESISQGEVIQVGFSSDGKKVIFITSDSSFHIWNYSNGQHDCISQGFSTDAFQALAISRRAPLAVRVGTYPRRFEVWNTDTHAIISSGPAPDDYVRLITLAPDDRTLICVLQNSNSLPYLAAFDMNAQQIRATFPTRTEVTALSQITDSGRLVCATVAGDLYLLSFQNFW